MNAPGPLPFPADGHAPAGHRLGHYELRGVAARNDHGIVYRAWDHELGIAVAIKEYLPRQLARRDERGDLQPQGSAAIGAFERGREAFVNEVRLLARCDHPSLLRVRQLLRLHGTVYRVMPWYQGWPLAELRREMTEPPDEPALRRLLLDVLGALETWHRVGGPHGSVNPAKILLLDDDRALLLGPGLARRAAGDGLEAPALPFDRPFQAPEQRNPSRQAPCGAWTDFYALAQVIRYCITGMLPQPDAPPTEPLTATVDALYFDAPRVRYDADFLRVLDAATAPAPGDRPQTVREFCDWLEHGVPRVPAAAPVPAKAAEPGASAAKAKADAPVDAVHAVDEADAADPVTALAPDGPVDIPLQFDSPAQATQAPLAGASPTAPDTTADANSETNFATASTTASTTGSTTGSTTTTPREEEPVDAATVDLIRRVIEAIPERHAPPPEAPAAFTEPILRIEDWQEAAAPVAPMRSARKAPWWLLGVVLLAAGVYAAWQWGGPVWEGLGLTDPPPSTAAAQPVVPSTAEPGAPAAAPAVAQPAEQAAPTASAPAASAAEPAAGSTAAGATSGATPEPAAPAAPGAAAATAAPAAPAAPAATAAAAAPTASAIAAAPAAPATAAAPAAPATAAAPVPPAAVAAITERPATPSTAPSAPAPMAQARASGVATVVVNATPPAAPPRESTERAAAPPPPAPRRATPESPRQACGARTQFALYRCMQQQCAMPAWARHEQCVRLKATDRVE